MNTDLFLAVPQPEAPCRHCIENAGTHDEEIGLGFVWCSHVRYGAIYTAETGQWTISGPYGSEAEYKRHLMNIITRARRQCYKSVELHGAIL